MLHILGTIMDFEKIKLTVKKNTQLFQGILVYIDFCLIVNILWMRNFNDITIILIVTWLYRSSSLIIHDFIEWGSDFSTTENATE